jgi:hypothetical protein
VALTAKKIDLCLAMDIMMTDCFVSNIFDYCLSTLKLGRSLFNSLRLCVQ